MIDIGQFKSYVLKPCLDVINANTEAACNLMLGTMAQESGFGEYIAQIGGPAFGVFQIEPATYRDINDNYLKYRLPLRNKILRFLGYKELPPAERLISDLHLSTIMARIVYLRDPEPLPDADGVEELAAYYKRVYNTEKGKAKKDEFVKNYYRYVKVY